MWGPHHAPSDPDVKVRSLLQKGEISMHHHQKRPIQALAAANAVMDQPLQLDEPYYEKCSVCEVRNSFLTHAAVVLNRSNYDGEVKLTLLYKRLCQQCADDAQALYNRKQA